MSKTIRVIDLLNKIANGEELPKRIKTNNIIYHYCPSCDTYEDEKEKDIVIPIDKYCLNDTVEIIEEQEEIDIQKLDENIKYYNIIGHSENEKMLFNMIQDTANRINKLVQAVKQLYKKDKGEKNNTRNNGIK